MPSCSETASSAATAGLVPNAAHACLAAATVGKWSTSLADSRPSITTTAGGSPGGKQHPVQQQHTASRSKPAGQAAVLTNLLAVIHGPETSQRWQKALQQEDLLAHINTVQSYHHKACTCILRNGIQLTHTSVKDTKKFAPHKTEIQPRAIVTTATAKHCICKGTDSGCSRVSR